MSFVRAPLKAYPQVLSPLQSSLDLCAPVGAEVSVAANESPVRTDNLLLLATHAEGRESAVVNPAQPAVLAEGSNLPPRVRRMRRMTYVRLLHHTLERTS